MGNLSVTHVYWEKIFLNFHLEEVTDLILPKGVLGISLQGEVLSRQEVLDIWESEVFPVI